jgi:tetratricopeptide (TPR) repeat protein
MRLVAGVSLALAFCFGVWCDDAHAQARIALLIGNQAYHANVGALKNPHNDIALLEKTLRGLGFNVTSVRDAGLAELNRAVNAHVRRVQEAGPGTISFFYYSGHGAQNGANRTNYLIPVDVTSAEDVDLWDRSMRLGDITRQLRTQAGNAVHFVVFDACRNALKLTRAGTRSLIQPKGFAPIQETGMLLAFATAQGELASDMGDGAGPYARVLAEEIVRPGVEAVPMFRKVQVRVKEVIGQQPWLSFGALNEVHFAGADASSAREPAPQPSEAVREWSRIDKGSVAELDTFLRRHGASPEADYARARRDELMKQKGATPAPPEPLPRPGTDATAATCRRERGSDHEGTIKACSELIKRSPAGAESYYLRGNAYLSANRPDLAIGDYNRYLELSPGSSEVHTNRGVALLRTRQYERATRDFEQAIALKPTNEMAYNNLGEVYAGQGQYDRAVQYFDKAIRINPSARSHTNRGKVYQKQGSKNRAMAEYRQALSLDPSYLPAKEALQGLGVKR